MIKRLSMSDTSSIRTPSSDMPASRSSSFAARTRSSGTRTATSTSTGPPACGCATSGTVARELAEVARTADGAARVLRLVLGISATSRRSSSQRASSGSRPPGLDHVFYTKRRLGGNRERDQVRTPRVVRPGARPSGRSSSHAEGAYHGSSWLGHRRDGDRPAARRLRTASRGIRAPHRADERDDDG